MEVSSDCDLTVCSTCLNEGAKFPDLTIKQIMGKPRPKTNAEAIKTGMVFD